MKFASIATVLTLISVIQAQNVTSSSASKPATSSAVAGNGTSTSTSSTPGQLSSGYPTDGAKPVPKPEWLDLIKSANITNAPVLKSNGDNGPSTSGTDNYCDWAKSGCMGTSIGDCPKGMWGLTYDDGPSEFSPILYDFLKTTNQKATLFMIGANAIKYPATVKRAYDEGHEIAIHTWTHSYMTTLTNEQIVAELKWTELAIKEITGVSPRLFRPPYGDIDNRVRDIGTALGFTSVIWDHDTNDWMLGENAPGFKSEWIDGNFTEWIAEAATATTGGLSLEHDIQKVTVDAAIRNLPALQKAYKVVTVGQCAGVPSYKEGNATLPINSTAISSSAIPSATSSVPVTPAAPAITQARASTVNNASTSAAMHSTSTFSSSAMLVSSAAVFMFTLYLI
ncbi:glycoside hydrolase/deacetylase [Mucor ambiguus]|uniref:Glycoside hydrolase/deacetylase n=1 Tax=Mucor ambiguus TaxID=91626 RepID=A0A0C9N5J9_9FUNG|nr:glycoside hydrolase/deacetylase [Mucor ambiguus]